VNKMNLSLGYQIYTPTNLAVGKGFDTLDDEDYMSDSFKSGLKTVLIIIFVIVALIALVLFLAWYIPRTKNNNTY